MSESNEICTKYDENIRTCNLAYNIGSSYGEFRDDLGATMRSFYSIILPHYPIILGIKAIYFLRKCLKVKFSYHASMQEEMACLEGLEKFAGIGHAAILLSAACSKGSFYDGAESYPDVYGKAFVNYVMGTENFVNITRNNVDVDG